MENRQINNITLSFMIAGALVLIPISAGAQVEADQESPGLTTEPAPAEDAGEPAQAPPEEIPGESGATAAEGEAAGGEGAAEGEGAEGEEEGEAAEAPAAAAAGEGGSEGGERERPYWIRAVAEAGFLAVLDHRIQFGQDGTYFDYVSQGGQDNLFFVGRLSVELGLYRHHQIIFLYQPLNLETSNVLAEDIRVDGLDYPAGTPINFTYGFPFYRLSYLYDFFGRRDLEVAIGVSLQIRNATINFASQDGTLYRSERDIGPVPALKLRVTYHFPFGLWLGTEIDGMYAPVSYLNGSDEEIVGAILDASLRAGLDLPRNVSIFLNVRYLGGGAVGTDEDDEGPGDGYVRNWLHFLTVTLGVNWDIIS